MANAFFLVWSPTGARPPSYRHTDRQSAVAEATRLAREHRGAEFFVVCTTDRVVVDDVKHDVLVSDQAEIPF